MKSALFLALLFAQSAFALPVVCESLEKLNDLSVMRVKINAKRAVRQGDSVWDLYLLGVSARDPKLSQTRMYGSGNVDSSRIYMTLVKDNFVYGYVGLTSEQKDGQFTGKIRIGGLLRGREIDVVCEDEAL